MQMKRNTHFLGSSILLFFAANAGLAQEFRATLNGRVTDIQGAVVPSAKISVTNQESESRTETVSGPDGFYNIPFLAPSAYTIVIEAAGFKRYIREGVRLSANDRVTVDARLELGGV